MESLVKFKFLPTDVSSIDHKARLTLPFGFAVEIERTILTMRITEKIIMTRPREKIAPMPSFCLVEILNPINKRIGRTPTIMSDAMSMLVATEIALSA